MMILETPRLMLREFTEEDGNNAFLLNSDPEVIKYTGDDAFESIEAASTFLKNYDHYRKYGFGRWAVIEKSTGEFLGWCGLKYDANKNEYDIGYRFFRKYWGNGFATEAALACLKLGFEKIGMPAIVGRAMRDNAASIRVLEKIGLHYYKEDNCGGENGVVYRLTKSEWNKIPVTQFAHRPL